MKFDASRLFSRNKRSLKTVLPSKGSSDEHDDITVTEETVMESECESSQTTSMARNVCFDEAQNVYHDTPYESEEDLKSTVWYTKKECAVFKQANKEHVKRVRSDLAKKNRETWAESLSGIYHAFHQAKSPRDVQDLLDATRLTLEDDVIGVEHMIMPGVARDIADRREALLDGIAMIQTDHSLTTRQQRTAIAKMVQTKCRPARIYAMYLSHVRSHQQQQDR